jgi:glycosyltransferase involved in cell wall biosynthesis/uncharacterized protein YbaR (Trm112 family)/SAM-dependent methyltransferase
VNVLHVTGWLAPRYGGSTFVALQSAAVLAERGHEVEVITTNVDGDGTLEVQTGQTLDWGGVNATFHRLSSPRRFLTSWSMLEDLNRRVAQFDVVHIHSLYRFHTIAAATIARRRGVPYVIQPHGSLDPWHRAQRRRLKDVYHFMVEDQIIRRAAAVLCTSSLEERSIRDLGYRVPTWVVPVAIDAAELRAPAAVDHLLLRAAVDPAARIVTFLGRISEKKGVELLVASFVRTASEFPAAHLIVAGPDDEGIAMRLSAVVAAAGLADRVSFIGTVGGPEKRALLQRSDVFVLPSADESFGIAVAEAMAVGCPVVVSPHVAIADLIQSAGAGLVANRDAAEISRAIGAVLGDRTAAMAMGVAGKRLVDDEFTTDGIAIRLESLYRSVITARLNRAAEPLAVVLHASPTLDIQDLLACPICRGSLQLAAEGFACLACDRIYPIVDGIPVMVSDVGSADHDEIDHLHHGPQLKSSDHAHKAAQAEHFDRRVAEEFEITRPHGTPRLYRFLLREKFRRATRPMGPRLVGATALTVCGGSGMDAEFLARAGARVVSSDLSLGAARRTRERARRYGLDITPIVADVERLPFADHVFDLVLVHDGLHHLERPGAGLAEMARTSGRWVSVTEPARAAATALAIRTGLALEREEAGNRVQRLAPDEVEEVLRADGFHTLAAQRYAMFYRHEPGSASRVLSRRAVFPVVRAAWQLGNAVIGRAGNKLVVVAERQSR